MVELEDEHVALTAVGAGRPGEDVVDVIQVPAHRRGEAATWIVDVAGQARPSGALRSHAAMTVRAPDLALRDLLDDASPWSPSRDQ